MNEVEEIHITRLVRHVERLARDLCEMWEGVRPGHRITGLTATRQEDGHYEISLTRCGYREGEFTSEAVPRGSDGDPQERQRQEEAELKDWLLQPPSMECRWTVDPVHLTLTPIPPRQ